MTIHIHSIRYARSIQSDGLVLYRICERTTEELRVIREQRRPLLHWPIRKKIKEAA